MKRFIQHFQLLNVSACVWTGLLGGSLYLLLVLFWVPLWDGGSAATMLRWSASFAMGGEVLAPPPTFEWRILAYAVGSFWLAGLVFAFLVHVVLHRAHFWLGLCGGVCFGLGLYCIDFYYFDAHYPWLVSSRSLAMISTYLMFGGFTGGFYHFINGSQGTPLKQSSTG